MKEIITITKIDDKGNVIGTSTEVKEVIEEKKEETKKSNSYSIYARMFDDGCPGWTKNPEYNLAFLKNQEAYANMKLKAKGHLFLNEVYDMLGFPRSKAGVVVGWVYDEKNPIGDNFVDFGIYDVDDGFNARNSDFINGFTNTVILDFNVDGVILNLI